MKPVLRQLGVLAICLLPAIAAMGVQEMTMVDNTQGRIASDKAIFTISYESMLKPIVINRIHQWTMHIETRDGQKVNDATIEVIGGMPDHDHGLPTAPEVSSSGTEGDYLIEGMKFHMNGWWKLTVSISANGESDTVTLDLYL